MGKGAARFPVLILDQAHLILVVKVSVCLCVLFLLDHSIWYSLYIFLRKGGVTDGTAGQKAESDADGSEGSATDGKSDDDGLSQAESSIKNGEVIASAQGTKNGGTAHTQGN